MAAEAVVVASDRTDGSGVVDGETETLLGSNLEMDWIDGDCYQKRSLPDYYLNLLSTPGSKIISIVIGHRRNSGEIILQVKLIVLHWDGKQRAIHQSVIKVAYLHLRTWVPNKMHQLLFCGTY